LHEKIEEAVFNHHRRYKVFQQAVGFCTAVRNDGCLIELYRNRNATTLGLKLHRCNTWPWPLLCSQKHYTFNYFLFKEKYNWGC